MAILTLNAADQRTIREKNPSVNYTGPLKTRNAADGRAYGIVQFNTNTNLNLVNISKATLRFRGVILGVGVGNQVNVTDNINLADFKLNSGEGLSSINWNNYQTSAIAGQLALFSQNVYYSGWDDRSYSFGGASYSLDATGLIKNNIADDGRSVCVMITSSVAVYSPTYYGRENTFPYSEIGLSDFTLEITYGDIEQPAPIPSYPRDIFIHEGNDIVFSWQWNGTSGAQQSSVSLDYRALGMPSWTTVTLTTDAHTYILQGGLAQGSYEWRIKGTNEAGVTSEYSETVSFNVVGKPGAPLIDTPANETLTTIKWTSDNQAAYVITITDANGNELINESVSSGVSQFKPNLFLKGTYTVTVQYVNASGFWSEISSKTFVIDATGPDMPTINVLAQGEYNLIEATIPENTRGAILRSRDGENYRVIGLLNESSYSDATIESGVTYYYKVRAYAEGYTDSEPVSARNRFVGAIISGANISLNLKTSIENYAGLSAFYDYETALTSFSGRDFQMAEKGESQSEKIQRMYYVDTETLLSLRELQKVPRCFYRDEYGNAYPCTISGLSSSGFMYRGYSITIELSRLTDEEVMINV